MQDRQTDAEHHVLSEKWVTNYADTAASVGIELPCRRLPTLTEERLTIMNTALANLVQLQEGSESE